MLPGDLPTEPPTIVPGKPEPEPPTEGWGDSDPWATIVNQWNEMFGRPPVYHHGPEVPSDPNSNNRELPHDGWSPITQVPAPLPIILAPTLP